MAIVLLITTRDEPTIELPFLGKCIVGRSSSCEIILDDKQISGKHGVFETNSLGQIFYTDLGSTNGSFLNNARIQKIRFKLSETLLLGNTIITIDEKRLNSKESLAIGRGLENNENTLAVPMPTGTKSLPAKLEKKEEPNKKNSVVLNKALKSKIPKSNWIASKKDTIIDQEELNCLSSISINTKKNNYSSLIGIQLISSIFFI